MKRVGVGVAIVLVLVLIVELVSAMTARTLRQGLQWALLMAIVGGPILTYIVLRKLKTMDHRQSRFEKWIRLLVGGEDGGKHGH